MDKHRLFILPLLGILALPAPLGKKAAMIEAAGEIGITITSASMLTYSDNLDRMAFSLSNKEGVLIDNAKARTSNTSLTPTLCFNGVDYTIKNVTQGTATLNGYVAMMCQGITGTSSSWPMYFKHASGQGASGNTSWYPSDYPGFPKGEETSIHFYENTIIGSYKFLNEFTLRVSPGGTSFDFIYSPHEVNAIDCDVSNTYSYQDKTCASYESELKITVSRIEGKVCTGISILDEDGAPLDIVVKKNDDGTYSFSMPNQNVSVRANYEDVSYAIDFEGTVVRAVPGKAIGAIPEGKWAIDGFPISSKSIFLWEEDKVATRIEENKKTYTCSCYVDGELYQNITFTDEDMSISLPAIPYKEGYEIVGWDLERLEFKDIRTDAIYRQVI